MLRQIAIGVVAALLTASAAQAQSSTTDIVDTAVAAGSFTTLAKALQAADLLKPANKAKLRRILSYHVVSGNVTAADVVKLKSAKAVSGDAIDIKASGGSVMVEEARVTKTDITASNGVIHVIDSVMLPEAAKN
jgi:uncharacterized surface protein with fasciclin (FAS1) repeats